jgi:pyrroloquinoline quinone biosynthesis protein B
MKSTVKLKVLGSGQDGGVPHTGCRCTVCDKARRAKRYRRLAPSIALYDTTKAFCYLIDASPDFKIQVDMIQKEVTRVARKGKIPVSGILITHAHFGHINGLLHLGQEVLNENRLPVFCTASTKRFICGSSPFGDLVGNKNIVIREVCPGKSLALNGLGFTPIAVPHRGKATDTVCYVVEAGRRLIYVPDTDRWTPALIEAIAGCDVALIDGTFYSAREVPNYKEVPHPPVNESIRSLKDVQTDIYFTHINHTSALNRRGPERKHVESRGFGVSYDGMVIRV